MPLPSSDVGPFPEGRDHEAYDRLRRRVLWSLPTGLFVVGSRSGPERNLMTANWVMQVATSPKLMAVSVESDSVTRRLVEEGGGFSISVLPRTERAVVRRFVKPTESVVLDQDGGVLSMQEVPVCEVAGGLPCLSAARSWLACQVRHILDWEGDMPDGGAASHVLVIGEVVDVGEADARTAEADGASEETGILRMEDTRMNYGG